MRLLLLLLMVVVASGAAAACNGAQLAAATTVTATNRERSAAGLPALRADERLTAIAEHRVDEMAITGLFSHAPADGCDVFCLMRSAGLTPVWAGENIAWNNWPTWAQAADVAEDGWVASAPHEANILNCHFTLVGAAAAQSPDGRRWFAQVFWGDRSC